MSYFNLPIKDSVPTRSLELDINKNFLLYIYKNLF